MLWSEVPLEEPLIQHLIQEHLPGQETAMFVNPLQLRSVLSVRALRGVAAI